MKNAIQVYTIVIALLLISDVISQPIVADFQVNENGTNRWDQSDPGVIALDNNNYLVFWLDSRAHDEDKPFAQIFDNNGNPQGDSFFLEGVQSVWGAKAVTNGSFLIFGPSENNSGYFIHRFDSDGIPVGDSVQVGGTGGYVAWGDSGKFMTTWKGGNFYGDIYARLYAADGKPLTDDFQVNDDLNTNIFQRNPSIDANSSGEYIITWEDGRVDFNGGDIWAQRYNKEGQKVGSNFPVDVDTPPDLIRQTGPVCAINDSGNFAIAWNTRSWEHTDHVIYAQRFDHEGNRSGDNFTVTDSAYNPYSSQPEAPAIAMNQTGKFIITWSDNRNENEDIYAQYYDSNGTAIGENLRINDDTSGLEQSSPYAAADDNNDFILSWWDDRNDGYGCRIFMQKFAENGELTGDNFHTTTNDTIMVQTFEDNPSIIVDKDGNFLVFWYDKRQGASIYAQRYSSNGSPIDTNIRLEQALSTNMVSNDNRILIVDRKTTDNQIQQIFGQICSFDGILSDSIFQISDDSTIIKYSTPAVSGSGADHFIVTWQDQRNDAYDIYARRINENGIALENSFKVNDDIGSDSDPCVASNSNGTFLIAWTDFSHEDHKSIYAQLYSAEGIAINSNFKVSSNTGGESLQNTTAAAIGNDNFVIAWTDYTNKDIYAQIIAGNGLLIDTNFQVGAGPGSQTNHPAIASDEDGNFIISWNDNRNQDWPDDPWEIFAQRFNSDGTPLGQVFKVSNNTNLPHEYEPDIKLFNNKIYTTWPERDRFDLGTGIDIWVNVLDWNNPVGINDNLSEQFPAEFKLNQNYPNPFNPVTTIRYSLPVTCHLDLSIYNILGQKVTTLVSEMQNAGNYEVEWDASQFTSGVYLVQLTSNRNYSKTIKMILIK